MPNTKTVIELGNIAWYYILEAFKKYPDTDSLLRSIDKSQAKICDGRSVGPISLDSRPGKATIIGQIYLSEKLGEEVVQLSQIEAATAPAELPEVLASNNEIIRRAAERKYVELTNRERLPRTTN